GVELVLPGQRIRLKPHTYSPWVRLTFRAGLGVKVRGICRFYLKEASPGFGLYLSPLNIDPETPALPLSHPFVYAPYLAKVFGPYATLGLAEDTSALNEGVLDEEAFLAQAYDIHAERERMFFDACRKVDHGMVACVFDITDRIQHVFWQYTQEGRGAGSQPEPSDHDEAVEECYRRMDEMIGRVRKTLGRNDLLMVVSDHGFAAFHTCVNLNAWLRQHGFLALKDGARECGGYFKNVDWPRTKAYALGLGGIFINQAGREAKGIVEEGEERLAVVRAIAEGLRELEAPGSGERVVRRMFDLRARYRGPYAENGPDLIVGFADGYRVSWDCVTGGFGGEVITPNKKPWSGDHCIDPAVVPGVFFSNRPISADRPGIIDVAPTVLDAFGIPAPSYMQGESLLADRRAGILRSAEQEASEDGERAEAILSP
ncbi:MAG: alkaline phosphatase family protein, partial [Planctomycetota bacterium]